MVDLHELSYDFISLLTNNPSYISRAVVDKTMLHEEYQNYFEAIQRHYLKFKRIDVVDLEKRNLRELYDSCVYNGIAIDIKDSFMSYQSALLDIYKRKIASELFHQWEKGVIEDQEYFRKLGNLQSLNVTKLKRLTPERMKKSLTKTSKKIKFNRFGILEHSLKLEEHDLMTLAADTAVGKTALAINLLEDLSRNYPCLYFNMEMSEDQISERLLAIHSKENVNKLENYIKQNDDFKKEIDFRINNLLKDRNIFIVSESQSLNKLNATIASFNQDKHFIVFVDHAGLISVKGSKNRNEAMTTVYQTLRKISLDYNCTIISLCQLNREGVKNDPRPKLSSLKDSSEIEQSSSKVTFIYFVENEEIEKYYFDIAKNRNGIRGNMKMTYNKANQYMEIVGK